MLCGICQEVTRAKKDCLLDEDGTILCALHPNRASFHKSATGGCHICALVWNSLKSSQHNYLLELDTQDPITNIPMAGPQILEAPNPRNTWS